MQLAIKSNQIQFKEIELHDLKRIKPFLDEWKLQNSELSFASLYIWGKGGAFKYLIYEDFLVIMVVKEGFGPVFFTPMPLSKQADYSVILGYVNSYCDSKGFKPVYVGVTSPFKEKFEQLGYTCTEDRNNFDYIYNTADLINLPGKKYHSKRNHINRFLSTYQYEYQPLEKRLFGECMDVYNLWLSKKGKIGADILWEKSAVKAALQSMDELGLIGACIRINGNIEAFTIGEKSSDMAIIHVEKANDEFEGIYTFINQQFAEKALSDTRYINREEDMGIDGMRRAKLSYHPEILLKKYTVSGKV